MLDSETKRRIDSCRDILVGKVPDPKSQVEQITIALIYKFMNDMDIEAEALGGHRKYFKGDFDKYAWAKLVASGMGGHEMLALYGEAITKMSENSGIPELFRDIFKNAYLPYRDPETLRSFLKEIDSFKYDHSERLGDAFEYLLSVLGSQGDAGQFRTPRHIIDFMVEIVNPQKGEVILDPACGTAGFLISAYKHILKHNSSDFKASKDKEAYDEKGVPLESLTLENPMRYKGDLLTPDERKKLAKDIKGYDISPDMVRLSLVNMYLHGFPEPDIVEYDTLTSEEKWNDYADIVLANPPFMTPKGGIRPHKRFSITASRSEVLFVDYIAEHLTPNGRAAIVVPEGIIFQSGGAYKQLRELLVKQSLIAVISLPAGVFNPYSGVKTSILVLDKRLAKKTNNILFVKIENEGFNLGAQRRPIDKNDLPATVKGLEKYIADLQNGRAFEPERHKNFSVVEKDVIAEGGEFNLSGERYGLDAPRLSDYNFVSLGNTDLFQVESGGTPKSTEEYYWNGDIYWSTLVDLPAADFVTKLTDTERKITKEGLANSSAKVLPPNSILVSSRATIGRIAVNLVPSATNQGFKNIVIKDAEKVDPYFVAYMMKQLVPKMESLATGGTFKEISKTQFCTLEIPLPPIEVQREIVAEIEGYQKIIDGAKQIVANYQPRIPVSPDWPIQKLEDVTEVNPKKSQIYNLPEDMHVSFVPMADLSQGEMLFIPKEIKTLGEVLKQYTYFQEDDVLLAKVTPCFENGKSGIARGLTNRIGFGSSEYYVLRPDPSKVLPEWIYFNIIKPEFIAAGQNQMTGTGGLQRVPKDFISQREIAVPDLDTQKNIVYEIEREQSLVKASKDLIQLFEAKIKAAINRVWGEAA